MPKFRVYPYATVSTVREVEAESPDEAVNAVLDEGFPGVLFTTHEYPDVTDWDADVEAVERLDS